LKVFIRGSKMHEKSGIWQGHFFEWLAWRNPGSKVTLADPGEFARPSLQGLEICYIVDVVDEVIADVLIDDAQESDDASPAPRGQYTYYSYKKQGQEMFLNYETRLFSHSSPEQSTLCPCAVCKKLSIILSCYEEEVMLRGHLATLGYDYCILQGQRSSYLQSDMRVINAQIQSILVGDIKSVTPQMQRVEPRTLELLQRGPQAGEIGGIDESLLPENWQGSFGYTWEDRACPHISCACTLILRTRNRTWKIGSENREQEMSKIINKYKRQGENICHIVAGKVVEFIGVPSTFFDSTPLATSGAPEVIVYRSNSIAMRSCFPYMFTDLPEFSGYAKLPYSWKGFSLFVRADERRKQITIPGMPPILSPFEGSFLLGVGPVPRGEIFFLRRNEQWELTKDPDKAVFFCGFQSGYVYLQRKGEGIPSQLVLRIDFITSWQKLQGKRIAILEKRIILQELRMYSRTIAPRLTYAKVLCLPQEIVDLIDFYIVT